MKRDGEDSATLNRLTKQHSKHPGDEKLLICCDTCAKPRAATAKFCAFCGGQVKLKASPFGLMRMKLPALEHHSQAMSRTAASLVPRANQDRRDSVKPRKVSTPPARIAKPARIEKLAVRDSALRHADKEPSASSKWRHTNADLQPQSRARLSAKHHQQTDEERTRRRTITLHQRESDRGSEQIAQDLAIKDWAARTRHLLEILLELRGSADCPAVKKHYMMGNKSLKRTVAVLQSDFNELCVRFVIDVNFQDKCLQMLEKVMELESEVSQKLQNSTTTTDNQSSVVSTSAATTKAPSLQPHHEFPDAEMVIRGRDGKKMFFKKRFQGGISTSEPTAAPPRPSALVVPHSIREELDPDSPEEHQVGSTVLKPRRISQGLSRQQWPASLLLKITRIQERLVIVRVDEDDESGALIISAYSPATSQVSTLAIPFNSLGFLLPASLVWYRTSEVQRCKQVESHWRICLRKILKCLHWKSSPLPSYSELELDFAIQFRQGKIFSFRTYESFPGLLSVRLRADFALTVEFVSVKRPERLSIGLPERNLVMLWSDYRARLYNKSSRDDLLRSICQKLYFEYTSRGFELVFPGLSPKGRVRRHPQETSMLEVYNRRIEDERQRLTVGMNACIHQATTTARRRLENYRANQQLLRKQRQSHAAASIQARIRHTIGRNQHRRESKLQRIAAVLIQRQFRKQRERELARRARKRHLHDRIGTSFRYACRLNQTLLLLNVTVNEIDSEANLLELELRGWHPSSKSGGGNAPAVLRIPCGELQRIVSKRYTSETATTSYDSNEARGRNADMTKLTRREVVELVVQEHLDVFRSAKHTLLVLSTKM